MKLESWLLLIIHRDKILMRTHMEHLLQTCVFFVPLLPIGLLTFFKQMVDKGLLVLRNHFHMQCIWFSDTERIWLSTHHIRSPKLSCKACAPYQLFTFRRARIYQLCNLSFACRTRSFERINWHWKRYRINYIWPRRRCSNAL